MVARPKRFELLTPRFVVWCSIQLSYGRFCQIRTGDRGRGGPGIAKGSVRGWQGCGSGPCVRRRTERPMRSLVTGCRADAGFAAAMAFGRSIEPVFNPRLKEIKLP